MSCVAGVSITCQCHVNLTMKSRKPFHFAFFFVFKFAQLNSVPGAPWYQIYMQILYCLTAQMKSRRCTEIQFDPFHFVIYLSFNVILVSAGTAQLYDLAATLGMDQDYSNSCSKHRFSIEYSIHANNANRKFSFIDFIIFQLCG